jgi:hypothetical protein
MVALAVLAAAPVFAYGRMSGNIRAERVTIASSGRVSVEGIPTGRRVSARKLAALQTLARRQRLSTLPPLTTCSTSLPDIATRYITYHRRTVRARGSCSKRFEAMYAALARATGVP